MKKVLSIMLSVMMLASIFAVNASAAPVATYEAVNMYAVDDDFQAENGDITILSGNFEKVLEAGSETNFVMDGREAASVMYADSKNLKDVEKFVLEFDVLPVFATSSIAIGFNHPVYGDYGFQLFPGSFNNLSLKNPSAAQSSTNYAYVESEDAIKGEDWYSVRVTVDRTKIDAMSAYEGYYFNYPKAVDENGKEIAVEAWGKTAGIVNSVATQNIAKALKIEIDKGDGYVKTDVIQTGLSYGYANQPRVQVTTGVMPAAISGSDLCIQVKPSTTWYESVFTSVTEGEGEEAVTKDVSLGSKAVYQFDNVKVYYETEQLEKVTDGTIITQDYEDVANNAAATKRENYGTATVMTEDGNSFLKFESTQPSATAKWQGYTTLINNSDFDSYDWEFSMDVKRQAGKNAIGINLYGYNADFVNGLTKDTLPTEACAMIPSSEFEADTWYSIRITCDPVISADGKSTYRSYKILKKNLEVADSAWEPAKYIFYLGNPSNASGKLVIQLTADVGARQVDVADGKLNPTAAATTVSEVNDVATYYIDNLKFTKDETVKVTDIVADAETASAKVTFGNASKYFTKDTYNLMMVAYDGEGRVVSVDMNTVAPAFGVVEDVELSVDKTDDVRIYAWETSTGAPLMGKVFDIDEWFDKLVK